jgi:hypothetical protein
MRLLQRFKFYKFSERFEVSVGNVYVIVNRYTAVRTEVIGSDILNTTLFLVHGASMIVNVEGSSSWNL